MKLSDLVTALGGTVEGLKYDPEVGYWSDYHEFPCFPDIEDCTLETGLTNVPASLVLGLSPRKVNREDR